MLWDIGINRKVVWRRGFWAGGTIVNMLTWQWEKAYVWSRCSARANDRSEICAPLSLFVAFITCGVVQRFSVSVTVWIPEVTHGFRTPFRPSNRAFECSEMIGLDYCLARISQTSHQRLDLKREALCSRTHRADAPYYALGDPGTRRTMSHR